MSVKKKVISLNPHEISRLLQILLKTSKSHFGVSNFCFVSTDGCEITKMPLVIFFLKKFRLI
jgi:hypothetical protein